MNTDKIYRFLTINGINIEKDVFDYGIKIFKRYFLYLILVIPISIIFNLVFQTLFFIISYIPLKRYIGGFHFNSSFLCTLCSVLISIFIPYISMKTNKIDLFYYVVIYSLFIILTIIIGPIDHKNKLLTKNEKKIFKKRAIYVEIIYFFIIIIGNIYNVYIYTNIVFLSVCLCILGILFGNLCKFKLFYK